MHKRRRYTEEYKREAIRLAMQSGISQAQVARDLDMNSGLLNRWVTEHERFGYHELEHEVPAPCVPEPTPAISFVPVKLPAPPAPSSANIQIEVRRGATAVNIAWPVGAAAQ